MFNHIHKEISVKKVWYLIIRLAVWFRLMKDPQQTRKEKIDLITTMFGVRDTAQVMLGGMEANVAKVIHTQFPEAAESMLRFQWIREVYVQWAETSFHEELDEHFSDRELTLAIALFQSEAREKLQKLSMSTKMDILDKNLNQAYQDLSDSIISVLGENGRFVSKDDFHSAVMANRPNPIEQLLRKISSIGPALMQDDLGNPITMSVESIDLLGHEGIPETGECDCEQCQRKKGLVQSNSIFGAGEQDVN